MTTAHAAVPVGGNLWTKPMKVLVALAGLAGVLLLWRFVAGLGAVTALNDGFPWGLWIAYDVVTGTALACGGYAVALLVYILNRGQYHPLVRPALVTSALGYTLAGVSVFIDIGRWWNIWKVPTNFWKWNLDSILLEVALCIMAYMFVLWIELGPAFLERWKEQDRFPRLRRFSQRAYPKLNKSLLWIIALGMLLPTMHQSSLGSLMLLSGGHLHPLWFTPLLPLLFLVSCIGMGYGVVVIESSLSSAFFGRERETKMLASLSGAMVVVLALFLIVRFVDLGARGALPLAFQATSDAFWFWLEMLLLLVPLGMLMIKANRRRPGYLFTVALLLVFGGALYRFITYLVAFNPGDHFSYFPSAPEVLITVGLVALEIAVYIYLVKRFPILSGTRPPRRAEVS